MKKTDDQMIDEITKIRAKNNKEWMKLLRLAFKSHPDFASAIMSQIVRNDEKVTKLMNHLGKGKK